MHSVAYYSVLWDRDNNFEKNDIFLGVNCCGHAVYDYRPVAAASRHDYYLFCLVRGEVSVKNPESFLLTPGCFCIFEKDSFFEYSATSDSVEYYWAHFTGSCASEIIRRCGISTNKTYSFGAAEGLSHLFTRLFLSFARADNFRELDRGADMLGILSSLGKAACADAESGVRRYEIIERSVEYIHKHISLSLSVAELAGAEFMSEGRYREIFRRALGMSPVDYIISLRINTACGLLRSTSMPVHEIAESVGYKDAAYFCRIFLKRTGMSPSDYRSSQ